ncbi:fumarylacetoacetate hydrolase family protein [Peribacillus alkalitolerans]|uniref:fumarylacetoacetate hydrolase family protein n=1 Tax=Peribacillus alkalitolerans TaxID=1550385 RepID=UPI0013D2FDCB|nr:fumarylacetoacetate hydrolase family protein [Peribacillus alkalitolerans]
MKLATVSYEGNEIVVHKDGGNGDLLHLSRAAQDMSGRADFLPANVLGIIQGGDQVWENVEKVIEWSKEGCADSCYLKEDAVTWKAPIPRPLKNIFCVGKNYADHAIEMGSADDIPEHVMMFSKAPTAVIGHEGNIPLHEEVTSQLDYEGELAVVIGKGGKAISHENAMEHVFGYTLLNDITARDMQSKHKQFLLGKSLDGSCPIGPYIVHKKVISNVQDLKIETKVNEEVRQCGHTSQFIFSIEDIISTISKGMTLEAGDIIATGTPAGVGKGFNPPKFLKKDDIIEISIDEIGTLKNWVK